MQTKFPQSINAVLRGAIKFSIRNHPFQDIKMFISESNLMPVLSQIVKVNFPKEQVCATMWGHIQEKNLTPATTADGHLQLKETK